MTNETNEYPKAGRISDEDFISDHHLPNSVYGNSNFQHPLTSICDRLTNAVPDRLYNASIKRNSSNSLEEIEIDLLDLQGELERIKKLQENNKHCEINPAEEESVLFYNKKASLEAFQEKVTRYLFCRNSNLIRVIIVIYSSGSVLHRCAASNSRGRGRETTHL